jgi:D-beta-D-heptose 7-phosphate kinase/D-beta-D-heptose 1-phosphate adenosyltransferase
VPIDPDQPILEASYQAAEAALPHVVARAPLSPILVIGDVMLDEFVFGSVQRISPEAPVPVVEITGRRHVPGGAANVASNVSALGARVFLAGVIGDDPAASNLCTLLQVAGIDSSSLLRDSARPTISKTRIVAAGQQIVRIDHESRESLSEATRTRLIEVVLESLNEVSACVISDYGKGLVSPQLVSAVVERAAARNIPVLVDPKGHDYRKYDGVTLVTPNLREAETAAAHPIANEIDLILAADRILSIARCAALLITQGPSGMTLFRPDAPPVHSAALARKVFDVTGAGDTVIATLALALACGTTLDEAMLLANIAAGIVVEKPGTATVSLVEIADWLENGRHHIHYGSPFPEP